MPPTPTTPATGESAAPTSTVQATEHRDPAIERAKLCDVAAVQTMLAMHVETARTIALGLEAQAREASTEYQPWDDDEFDVLRGEADSHGTFALELSRLLARYRKDLALDADRARRYSK